MADQPVRWTPLGNLDKDTEYKLVGKGNYTDALDVIKQDDDGQVSGTIQPTKRNKHAFSLGSVQAQNKKYRVTVSGDATKSHALRFLSTKRDYRITTGAGPNGEVIFDGTIASLQSAFNASNLPGAFQVSVSGNTMEFELAPYPYYQWYLESVGDDDVEVVCIQEAIPTDLAGPLKDIGSYDLLGDLFIFSTTQDNEPTELDVQIAGVGPISPNPSPPPPNAYTGPLTQLFFNGPHGLHEGQWISITDSDAPWLNGIFVVQDVLTPTDVNIVTDTAWGASHPAISVGSPKVFIHPVGIGEIGVAQKNNSTESWDYTRLLRSVELNFISKKDIRTDARLKGKRKIIYYTDKYNPPRNFVHIGDFSNDGSLFFNNEINQYRYDSISFQSSLLNSNLSSIDTKIEYLGQSDSGGGLSSGNKYYVFRFKDSEGSVTSWSDPTRAIPVFPKSLLDDDPVTIKGGSPSDQPTTKVVNLSIQDIPQGIFESVQVGVLDSDESGSLSGTIFNEIDLSQEQQSLFFSHTGIEDEQEALDVGEIAISLGSYSSIKTVGDLAIIDKRLVMGNISYVNISDLSDWASQFKHQIKYKKINGIGDITSEKIGGYLNPSNVFNHPSLVINETYRIGVDVVFNDGSVSPTFLVDTIKIDTSPINLANPTDNRRVQNGGLPHYALNNVDQDYSINVPYLSFSNIDMDYNFNGIPIRNAISTIRFRFAKIKQEVIASGFVVMGISGNSNFGPVYNDGSTSIFMDIGPQSNHQCQYLDWTGSYDVANLSSLQNQNVNLNGTRYQYPSQFTAERRTAFFYSPDISMGLLDDYELGASDRINIFYPIRRTKINSTQDNYNQERINISGALVSGPPTGNRMLPSLACEMIAYPAQTPSGLNLQNSNGFNQYDIEDAVIMNAGETVLLGGNPSVNVDTFHTEKSGGNGRFSIESFDISHSKCLAIRTDADMLPFQDSYWISEGSDYGVYYAQLFRDTPNKYQDNETTEYQSYSQSYDVDSVISIDTQLDIFGGDSFIVKTLLRNRFARLDYTNQDSPTPSGLLSSEVGRHLGMTYFSQTSMNMELVYNNPDFFSYPEDFLGTYTERWFRWTDLNGGEYRQFYNTKYSYGLSELTKNAFSNDLNELIEDVPTRIVWSSRDIYSSLYDSMKTFLPLNVFDLDGTFGELISLDNINGELFTLQPRKYQAQYFNSRGQLQGSSNSVEVLIGDGSVLSRDGQTLSSYGTQHKWSVVKGSSSGGKDVIYWFNQENGLFMRFGADGTVVLSERHGMRSFSANNTKWTENQHAPALNYGIRSVWDDRFKEAIWTFIGLRDSQGEWGTLPSNQLYAEGDTVTNNTFINYPFDGVPDVYVSLSIHAPIPQSEPGVGNDWETYWRRVDRDDPEYYSVFTLAFNELSNGFSTFYSHLPKTYLKWKNKFLSSHPTERSEIYEHRYGYDKWYEYDGVWKESEPFLEGVVNPFPDQSKKFVAIQALSDNVPDRIELKTKDHESFLVSADFDPEDDAWRSPVKNDILTSPTGDPNDDTESLVGSYMRVKFKFFNGAYNKLNNLIIKVRQRLRRTQS